MTQATACILVSLLRHTRISAASYLRQLREKGFENRRSLSLMKTVAAP